MFLRLGSWNMIGNLKTLEGKKQQEELGKKKSLNFVRAWHLETLDP